MSLLSLKPGTSESPSPESPKAQATVGESNSFKNHLACGSFVPNTPAIAVLRTFLPAMHPHAHWGTDSTCPRKEWEGNPSSSLLTPFITRSLSLPSGSRSPSPPPRRTLPRSRKRSRSRTRTRTRAGSHIHPHDLHPILAGLEQRSRFCVKKSVCATCNREGDGFPQCGKCGDSWCCRECRLEGRKKHSCAMKST